MELKLLKILLIFSMLVISLICGLLPLKLYDLLQKKSKESQFLTSMLSCFAGGVILGVCLLDMFPEASEQLEHLQELTEWKPSFPYLYLLIGFGFFLVYMVDVLVDHYFDIEDIVTRKMTFIKKDESYTNLQKVQQFMRANSTADGVPVALNLKIMKRRARKKAISTCFTFVAGLAVHTVLEGFAFGLQETQVSLTSLFFGIIVHKALVLFSVGMNLTEKLVHHSKTALITFIVLLACFSPIGALCGMYIEDSNLLTVTKAIVVTALMCFSIGCFLFVAFFEILCVERAKSHAPACQFISCFVGFICTAIMMFMANLDEDTH